MTLLHALAVLAVACFATVTASFLPIADPAAASGVCITAGAVAGLAADVWLPCPCHRKDHRS